MALQDKYAELIDALNSFGASDVAVREQNNVLYIDGVVSTGGNKDQLWTIYDKIDPDYRSGDLVLNISVSPDAPSSIFKVTTHTSNLNIRKGPGTDQPILGKAAHDSEVTLLSKYNDEWYLIRSSKGIEGYCSTKYLTQA